MAGTEVLNQSDIDALLNAASEPAPAVEAPLPATAETSPETPVQGAVEPDPNAAQGPTNQVPPRGTP